MFRLYSTFGKLGIETILKITFHDREYFKLTLFFLLRDSVIVSIQTYERIN